MGFSKDGLQIAKKHLIEGYFLVRDTERLHTRGWSLRKARSAGPFFWGTQLPHCVNLLRIEAPSSILTHYEGLRSSVYLDCRFAWCHVLWLWRLLRLPLSLPFSPSHCGKAILPCTVLWSLLIILWLNKSAVLGFMWLLTLYYLYEQAHRDGWILSTSRLAWSTSSPLCQPAYITVAWRPE